MYYFFNSYPKPTEIDGINSDYLLVLKTKEDGSIEMDTLPIEKNFFKEEIKLSILIAVDGDNLPNIVNFIKNEIKPKLPEKNYNYAFNLFTAYSNIRIDINYETDRMLRDRNNIYQTKVQLKKEVEEVEKEIKIEKNKETSRKEDIDNLINKLNNKKVRYENYIVKDEIKRQKEQISNYVRFWFDVFDIEKCYEKACQLPNILVHSHRIGGFSHLMNGWKEVDYNITENLKVQLKTNFGYGSSSYFYVLLIYKGIELCAFSDWITFNINKSSMVLRYTKDFKRRVNVKYDNVKEQNYCNIVIKNIFWKDALEYIMNAGNLCLKDEKKFIEKYIFEECEKMISELDRFLKEDVSEIKIEIEIDTEIYSIEDEKREILERKKVKHSFSGLEMINFKAEKIIGALDFIGKLIENNSIIPTEEYIDKILELCEKLVPYVHTTLKEEEQLLKESEKEYQDFLIKAEKERRELKNLRQQQQQQIKTNKEEKEKYLHQIKLHQNNVEQMKLYIEKYKQFIGTNENPETTEYVCKKGDTVSFIAVKEVQKRDGDLLRMVTIKDNQNGLLMDIPSYLSLDYCEKQIGEKIDGCIKVIKCSPHGDWDIGTGTKKTVNYQYELILPKNSLFPIETQEKNIIDRL